jgi:hypothetical protein
MPFTNEERVQIIEHRMRELEIESIAALARLAGCDRGNVHRFLHGEAGVLGAGARARLAEALRIDQEQLAALYAVDVIAVPLDVWTHVAGHGRKVDHERRKRQAEGPRPDRGPPGAAWRGAGKRTPPVPPPTDP